MTHWVRTPLLFLLTILTITPTAWAVLGVCSVRQYGAKGDGFTDDTEAIQKAIDACANKIKSPGMVLLDRGVFISGPLVITGSNEWLSIQKDAVLRATSHRSERCWDPARNQPRPLLLVTSGDLLLLGGGTIQSRSMPWEQVAVKAIGTGISSPYAPRPPGLVVQGNATVTVQDIHID